LQDARVSGESRTPAAARLARDGAYFVAALVAFSAAFGIAYGAGQGGFEAGTFALAAVAAFAGVTALVCARKHARREEQLARELHMLAEAQRLSLADAAARMPEPEVLLLVNGNQGTPSARIERRRPRRLDIEESVAHERTLALRTLPRARAQAADRGIGSLKIHREPTERDREEFRQKVERYAAKLRKALEEYEAYRREQALLVSGRFRFENHGRGPARNVKVIAHFPDPFEVVRERLEQPAIPRRPLFHRDRTRLAALMGGDPRAVTGATAVSREPIGSRAGRNVSQPHYREGSAIVEVRVELLPHSQPTDMDEDGYWALRLPAPGDYRIPWEISSDELPEPVCGELQLEVVELMDYAPIRSVKELLRELRVSELDRRLESARSSSQR
jgi:hypothetical protein